MSDEPQDEGLFGNSGPGNVPYIPAEQPGISFVGASGLFSTPTNPVESPPSDGEIISGPLGRDPFTFGGAPIGTRQEINVPAEIALARPIEINVSTAVDLAREVSSVFTTELLTVIPVSFSVPAERTAGGFFASLLREDEELLLLS